MMKKSIPFFILCSLFLALAACGADSPPFTGRVTAVADGDTITVMTYDNQQIKIRLYGIDCPERGQPFSNRARQITSNAVAGRDVTVQPFEIDRYGRTVGIVYISDDETLNSLLVREGMAWVYSQFCKQGKVCNPLKTLEKAARNEKRGLWADNKPVPPWEWRKDR